MFGVVVSCKDGGIAVNNFVDILVKWVVCQSERNALIVVASWFVCRAVSWEMFSILSRAN